jgi:glucose dehydrogenase
MSGEKRLIRLLVTLAFISVLYFLDVFIHSSIHAQQSQHKAGKDWSVYGGGPESTRNSSLKQINRENMENLKVAWIFDSEMLTPVRRCIATPS